VNGVLGEAAAGFPHVFTVGLPVIKRYTSEGSSLEDASVAALLHLIAAVDDTNVISRCGIETLREIQLKVSKAISFFIHVNQYKVYARQLDEVFNQKGISPGGCADLLAISLFIYFLLV
jgi:triphosphoribosyl-dephospho-CoA synthetase